VADGDDYGWGYKTDFPHVLEADYSAAAKKK
jgi:hypothetical protein